MWEQSESGSDYIFNACLYDIEDKNLTRNFSARSYIEVDGAIVKYTAIVNGEKTDETLVEALIEVKVTPKCVEGFDGIAKQIAAFPEVKGVYLMSGAYDLAVFIEDASLQKVARFVSERISTFDGVISTATHFILKKYKLEGVCTEKDEDRRISVQA